MRLIVVAFILIPFGWASWELLSLLNIDREIKLIVLTVTFVVSCTLFVLGVGDTLRKEVVK